MRNINKATVVFLLVSIITSCLNKQEKYLVGQYGVKSYKLAKGKVMREGALPILILKSNKAFVVKNGKEIIQGDWSINDYGDFTLFELFVRKELYAQAKYSEDGNIFFDNYRNELFDNNFNEVSFTKIAEN